MKLNRFARNSAGALTLLCLSNAALAEVTGPIMLSIPQIAPAETEVLAWSWGASNSTTTSVGGGGGVGKASFQDISISRYSDGLSPLFLGAVAQGTHLQELTIRRQGLEIRLEDAVLTSYSVGGVNDKKAAQTENITFNYAKVCFSAEGSDRFCFDVSANSTF